MMNSIGTKTKFKTNAKKIRGTTFLSTRLLKYSSNISATAYKAGAKKAKSIHIIGIFYHKHDN
jgi:hypothetical protein